MDELSPTDAELVAQTLAGNCEAFGRLYDRYARIVRAVVAGVSGAWPAVDDMVQECFLRAYRNLRKLRQQSRFGPWIVGIARQVGRERRRSHRRDRHQFGSNLPEVIETEASSETAADDRDQLEKVLEQMEGLAERERVAVHAFYLQQQDAGQVAQVLGLSRSGFYALVQRAVARLAAKSQTSGSKERLNR